MKSKVQVKLASIFTVLFLFFCSLELHAFEMTPISLTLQSIGKKSSAFIKLVNKHSFPKAIQVTMETREPDLYDREEGNKEAEDDFLVYPPQFILEGNSSKIFKISWIGDVNPERELAFRYIVDELDVELNPNKKKTSGVKLLMRYEGALYIQPDELVGSKIILTKLETGKGKISFILYNKGDTHQILRNSQVTISSISIPLKVVVLPREDLKGIEGQNILADKKREFQVALPEGFKEEDVTVNFTLLQVQK